jgi:hypothetical protein
MDGTLQAIVNEPSMAIDASRRVDEGCKYAPCAEPKRVRGIDPLQKRAALVALGAVNQTGV